MSGTDYTTTVNLGLYKPNFNKAIGTWGDLWNANADKLDAALGGGAYLPLVGGTVTGPITLPGNATQPLHAVPLQQLPIVPAASSALPLMDGAATVGTGATWARADHVHPSDTSRAAASALANYLPLAGGTLTGALTVGSGVGYIVVNPGTATNTGYLGFFNAAGVRQGYFGLAGSGIMSLSLEDTTKALQLNCNIGLNLAVPAGQAAAGASGGWIFAWGLTAANWIQNAYYDGTNWRYVGAGAATLAQANAGGFAWSTAASGAAGAVAPMVTYLALSATGTLTAYGTVVMRGITYFAASAANNFYMTGNGSALIFQFENGYYWTWNRTTGEMDYVTPNGALWNMRLSPDNLTWNAVGPVGGVGAYVNVSDERMKRHIASASVGLHEVLQLKPISFTRIKRDMPELGFSAQQVRKVIPEAVMEIGIELPDGTGGMGSEEPTLAVTDTPILAAVVNAVKELAARVEAIEGRARQ